MAIWPCPVAIVLAVCVWSGCAAAAEPAARFARHGWPGCLSARHLENHGVAFGAPSRMERLPPALTGEPLAGAA